MKNHKTTPPIVKQETKLQAFTVYSSRKYPFVQIISQKIHHKLNQSLPLFRKYIKSTLNVNYAGYL